MKQEHVLSTIAKLIRQDRRSEIRPYIISPSIIERSELIPSGDPVAEEARIVADAFESASNGMHNPEAFEALETIDEGSPFFGWKQLSIALHLFYTGDYDGISPLLASIPKDSPAALLVPLIQRLCGEELRISKGAEGLYQRITEDRSYISAAIKQLTDCLEADMEELFIETALLLIRNLRSQAPLAAKRLALWAMNTVSYCAYDPDELISGLKALYGSTEAFRLCALGLETEETEIALLFWIRSLLSRLKQAEAEQSEKEAYLLIIARLAKQVEEFMTDTLMAEEQGYGEEERSTYLESLQSLYHHLRHELGLPDTPLDPGQLFSHLADLSPRDEKPVSHMPVHSERSEKPRNTKPVQLELFA